MACYRPLSAYRLLGVKSESGKDIITFTLPGSGSFVKLDLPCGQCIGCRIERSRHWALRCVHEASLYDSNCFITLTFDEFHIKDSLCVSDFQLFMKRLRKRFSDVCIRFFHCGEYGTLLKRPHHHACLFNFDFPDKVIWSVRSGVRLYRSAILEELWPFGFSTVGDVTLESAAYVARYCTKKITGAKAAAHYVSNLNTETGEFDPIKPEFITMSRRPGIARDWIDKYKGDVYPKDSVSLNGSLLRPPRYYDNIYDSIDSKNFCKIKKKRVDNILKCADNNTIVRLRVRETVADLKHKKLIRSFESEVSDVPVLDT